MSILLIGGTGLIGRELQTCLEDKQLDFMAPNINELNLEKPADIRRWINTKKPRIVVNCASYTLPWEAEQDPQKCMRINFEAVELLAKICQANGATLIHLSTYRVFDGKKKEPYVETDEPNSKSVLGRSRAMAERAISKYCDKHIILRLSWIISDQHANLLTYLLHQLDNQHELSVVVDQQGCPTPPDDVARVVCAIIQQLNCGASPWGIYHYAGTETVSESRFAEALMSEASQYKNIDPSKLTMVKLKERHGLQAPGNAALNCRKILATFGIHTRSWRGPMTQLLQRYYNHQPAP